MNNSPSSMKGVVLGLGSNIGDRLSHLRTAKRELAGVITSLTCSPVYETAALLPEGAPPEWDISFYNMAISGQTTLAPYALLAEVKRIEQALGRTDRGRWGPREIDIDILAYGDTLLATPELTLPHAGLLQRDFALVPFADLWPGWKSADGISAGELAEPMRKTLQKQEQGID